MRISLKHLFVKDFRRIENLDIELPQGVRVICFVGPNGGGKSSLLSKLANSLCLHTRVPAPDFNFLASSNSNEEGWLRSTSTGEIREGQPGYLIRSSWELDGQAATYTDAARRMEEELPKDFFDEEDGVIQFYPGNPFANGWNPVPTEKDPIANSVFLMRPADRSEKASYEESRNFVLSASLSNNWVNSRHFPFKVKSWSVGLEQFLYSMFIEEILKRPLPTQALSLFKRIYEYLIDETMILTADAWPFVRVGPVRNSQLSSLSAGELDVLVTAGLIIAQALALTLQTKSAHLSPEGIVFIDEVDCHLHPQWQQKIMPALCQFFPKVTFVITTHSPFVLRSLGVSDSIVIRLPDGVVFKTNFGAWQIDDILEIVFSVRSSWSQSISEKLRSFERLVENPQSKLEAFELYLELMALDSAGLQAECRRLAGLFGSSDFVELIAKQAKVPSQSDTN